MEIDDIMVAVARYFDLPVETLKGFLRISPVASARKIALLLCYNCTDLSLTEIGRSFGHRHHSTVHHGVSTASETERRIAASIERYLKGEEGGAIMVHVCVDCKAEFETSARNAERCPLCRKVYRRDYAKKWREKTKVILPEWEYPDVEPLPEKALLALDDDAFLVEVYRILGEDQAMQAKYIYPPQAKQATTFKQSKQSKQTHEESVGGSPCTEVA